MSETRASFGFQDVETSAKADLVRGVFDRVASRYDLMNDLMSAGVHRVWKDMAAARLNPQPGERIVDCAGGTGDMARRLDRLARATARRRGGADAEILVVDYNAEMVGVGRARALSLSNGQTSAQSHTSAGAATVRWAVGDAQRLPLPDAWADAYVIAFGIRNVTDIARALVEARRVLKPGGRFLCLEFSQPPAKALRALYDAYSFRVIPAVGQAVAHDRASYQYLVESIRRFPDQARFAAMIADAGFSRAGYTNLSGGVAALHHAWAL